MNNFGFDGRPDHGDRGDDKEDGGHGNSPDISTTVDTMHRIPGASPSHGRRKRPVDGCRADNPASNRTSHPVAAAMPPLL
ncbi:hypothetical protein CEE86_12945, partial [Lactobacillus crispatus]